MFFKVIKSGMKKNVYKNVSSHVLKPHLKLLSFTFGTPESDSSVLRYLKEKIRFSSIFSIFLVLR